MGDRLTGIFPDDLPCGQHCAFIITVEILRRRDLSETDGASWVPRAQPQILLNGLASLLPAPRKDEGGSFHSKCVGAVFVHCQSSLGFLDRSFNVTLQKDGEALEQIQKGEAGFKDRDLYAFCANASDGIITAHPSLKGKNIREIKDKDGKALGEEMMKVATDGKVDEVSYMWPRPGADTTPVQKVSFVTKAGDQVCGVGYYK
jgi:hypothetical protein